MKSKLFSWLCIACLFYSCGQSINTEPTTEVIAISIEDAPVFNADSAFAYIQQQVDFGPRTPNSEAHQACAAFLHEKMQGYADQVLIQEFESRNQSGEFYQFSKHHSNF